MEVFLKFNELLNLKIAVLSRVKCQLWVEILPAHQGGILKYTDCVTEGNAINNKKEKEIPLS